MGCGRSLKRGINLQRDVHPTCTDSRGQRVPRVASSHCSIFLHWGFQDRGPLNRGRPNFQKPTYGWLLDPYYTTAPNILGTQEGTIIFITTHIQAFGFIAAQTYCRLNRCAPQDLQESFKQRPTGYVPWA